jgi:hypothetical protein
MTSIKDLDGNDGKLAVIGRAEGAIQGTIGKTRDSIAGDQECLTTVAKHVRSLAEATASGQPVHQQSLGASPGPWLVSDRTSGNRHALCWRTSSCTDRAEPFHRSTTVEGACE